MYCVLGKFKNCKLTFPNQPSDKYLTIENLQDNLNMMSDMFFKPIPTKFPHWHIP